PYNQFRWSKSTIDGAPATVVVSSGGVRQVSVFMREDGMRVDRLLLTTDAGYVPAGTGPAESPRA
ncbi:MAG: hypothetical protein AB7V62_16930, partial [Thermoleophilia bacterium]